MKARNNANGHDEKEMSEASVPLTLERILRENEYLEWQDQLTMLKQLTAKRMEWRKLVIPLLLRPIHAATGKNFYNQFGPIGIMDATEETMQQAFEQLPAITALLENGDDALRHQGTKMLDRNRCSQRVDAIRAQLITVLTALAPKNTLLHANIAAIHADAAALQTWQRSPYGKHVEVAKHIVRNRLATPAEIVTGSRQISKVQLDYEELRNALVMSDIRLISKIAQNFQRASIEDIDDFVQDGVLGAMHAIDLFEWWKDTRLSTYVTWWVRQAVLRGRSRNKNIPLPEGERKNAKSIQAAEEKIMMKQATTNVSDAAIAQIAGLKEKKIQALRPRKCVSLHTLAGEDEHDLLADRPIPHPEIKVDVEMMFNDKRVLRERHREILRLRFGLDGEVPHTLEEAGKRLNVTRERVRQVEAEALQKLREYFGASNGNEE